MLGINFLLAHDAMNNKLAEKVTICEDEKEAESLVS